MATPQARLRVGPCDVLLLGTLHGFEPEAQRVQQAFDAFAPDLVALGVPREDLDTLQRLADDDQATLPDLEDVDAHLLKVLARWGPTRVPSPDLETAQRRAAGAGVALVALDVGDQEHAALFTRHVKLRHLFHAGRVKKKALARDFAEQPDAYAFAAEWDRLWTAPGGLRRVEEAREEHMAARLREESTRHARLLAVVPANRLPGIVKRLQAPAATS